MCWPPIGRKSLLRNPPMVLYRVSIRNYLRDDEQLISSFIPKMCLIRLEIIYVMYYDYITVTQGVAAFIKS